MTMDEMKEQMTWPIRVVLREPIRVRRGDLDVELRELSVQQIRAKHLRYIQKDPPNVYFIVPLVAGLTGLSEEEAGELSLADLLALVEILGPFLEGLPAIGKR